jgi:hypothetical protein
MVAVRTAKGVPCWLGIGYGVADIVKVAPTTKSPHVAYVAPLLVQYANGRRPSLTPFENFTD